MDQSRVIFQAVGFFRLESCPTQAVRPLVGLAANKVIRDRYVFQAVGFFRLESCPTQAVRPLVGLAADKLIRDRYVFQRLYRCWASVTQSENGHKARRLGCSCRKRHRSFAAFLIGRSYSMA
ncbi:MAG: hypothetical protein ACQESR_09005 [Planctomycetota bacterium]